jgi:hypothetical protein
VQRQRRTVNLGTKSVTTGADGTFRLTMSVKGGDHSYEVDAAYADEGGRRITEGSSAWVEGAHSDAAPSVVSTRPGADADEAEHEYGVGEAVSVRFVDGIRDPEVAVTCSRSRRAGSGRSRAGRRALHHPASPRGSSPTRSSAVSGSPAPATWTCTGTPLACGPPIARSTSG